LTLPTWILKPMDANGMPVAAAAPAPVAPKIAPDLVSVGLCRRNGDLVFAAYGNRGQTGAGGEFAIRYSGPWYAPAHTETSMGKLPAPGGVGFAALGNLGRFANVDDIDAVNLLKVELDANHDIAETNENNNRDEYQVGWRRFDELPFCDALHM
jgi:hypothetical protein